LPILRIAHYSTDPSVKAIMATIADQESEHNHSYAYVLSSVATYDQQIETFEYGRKDPVLLKRNERIKQVYNEFASRPTLLNVLKAMVYSALDRKSTRLNSSHVKISYAVFCLKKKN